MQHAHDFNLGNRDSIENYIPAVRNAADIVAELQPRAADMRHIAKPVAVPDDFVDEGFRTVRVVFSDIIGNVVQVGLRLVS